MQGIRREPTVTDFLEQRKKVNQLLQLPNKGENWYIIDVRWWNKWSNFVDTVAKDESLDVACDDYPGEVDNTALLSCGKLKPDLLREADFTLIPKEVWNIFVNFYGCSHKDSTVFRRTAIGLPNGRVTIEIYPPTFQFVNMDTDKLIFEASFSECQTIGEVKSTARKFLNADKTENIQLFVHEGNTHEEFKDDTLTIGEASLERQKFLYLKRGISNGLAYGIIRQKEATPMSYYTSSSPPTSTIRQTPGMCGLNNLGNTCFMNSAIQCISNVPELTNFFTGGKWKCDLNKYNPLGSRGKIATAYAELINHMWSGLYSSDAPRALKREIAGIASQFYGYSQHDSHELLVFLVDGIHEDLNRVKEKPYIEVKDADGRPDEVVAAEAWRNHLARNDSIIVDLFHGQLKSTVICPTCSYRSVTFDPFASLNLPLPDLTKYVKVVYIWPWICSSADRRAKGKRVDGLSYGLIRCEIPVQSTVFVRDLLLELERQRKPYTGCQYHLAEVYNNSLSRPWHPGHQVRDRSGPPLFAYELPLGNLLSVRLRDSRQYNISGWVGVPFYISIPKRYEEEVPEDLILQIIVYRLRVIGLRHPVSLKANAQVASAGSDVAGNGRRPEEVSDSDPCLSNDTDLADGGTQKTSTNGDDCSITDWLRGNVFCTDEQNIKQVRLSETGKINLKDYYGPPRLFIDCAGTTLHTESEKLMRSIGSLSVSTVYSEQKNAIKLENCVQRFTSVEQLGARDLWYCSKCEDHKQATKHFELWSLPKIIVIQLKRFRSTYRSSDKINTLVEFPTRGLDLTNFLANVSSQDRFVYDLIAVSNHMGCLGGGHYTAYALNDTTQRWCLFDDSLVREVDESSVVTPAAYVLIYRRRETNQSNCVDNGVKETIVSGVDMLKRFPSIEDDMDNDLSDGSEQFLQLE